MITFSPGDLVLAYQSMWRDTGTSRGIVIEDQKIMGGGDVVQVVWPVSDEYRQFADNEESVSGYTINWERVEMLGLISKLTTEELLLHDHPAVQAIGKQRARDESSD